MGTWGRGCGSVFSFQNFVFIFFLCLVFFFCKSLKSFKKSKNTWSCGFVGVLALGRWPWGRGGVGLDVGFLSLCLLTFDFFLDSHHIFLLFYNILFLGFHFSKSSKSSKSTVPILLAGHRLLAFIFLVFLFDFLVFLVF